MPIGRGIFLLLPTRQSKTKRNSFSASREEKGYSDHYQQYYLSSISKLNPLLRLVRRCSTKVRINFEEEDETRSGLRYVHQIPIKFKMKEKSRTAIFFHNLIGNLVT